MTTPDSLSLLDAALAAPLTLFGHHCAPENAECTGLEVLAPNGSGHFVHPEHLQREHLEGEVGVQRYLKEEKVSAPCARVESHILVYKVHRVHNASNVAGSQLYTSGEQVHKVHNSESPAIRVEIPPKPSPREHFFSWHAARDLMTLQQSWPFRVVLLNSGPFQLEFSENVSEEFQEYAGLIFEDAKPYLIGKLRMMARGEKQ